MFNNRISIFEAASEISSNHRCGNCGIMMDQVKWRRCQICKQFHLCKLCETIEHDALPQSTLNKHRQLHSPEEIITRDWFSEVCFGDVEADEREARLARRAAEYQRILQEGRICNDYDMYIVMKTLFRDPPPVENQISSLILQYHLTANERKINILSLDGGGKANEIRIH